MATPKFVSARDGEKNSVIYKTAEGQEFIYSGGHRAWRNNNPGNIGSAEKSGLKIGKGGKFAVFASPEDGMAALKFLLTNFYAERTLAGVFEKYAPRGDNNDPDLYVKQVVKFTGLNSDQKVKDLSPAELQKLMEGIRRKEGNKPGRIDPVPHAQQFVVKGVDDRPLSGIAYVMSFFTSSGDEKKVSGTTDDQGKTAVAKSDTRTPVTLKLPRPDPGQSLKGTGAKASKETGKQVTAAEVKAKPWYEEVFEWIQDSDDERDTPDAAPAGEGGGKGDKPAGKDAKAADKKDKPAAKSGTAAASTASTAKPPVATVKQAGAVKASGTKEKSQQYVEGVVTEPGVFVTWKIDTSSGSGKVLNGLPYFIAEMNGSTGKPLVEHQRVRLMRANKIRQKVPFGKEVALYLGNDAKAQYRTTPLFKVKAEEGLTDVIVKIAEKRGPAYNAAKEIPHDETVDGTKKTFSAVLYGQTWMKFSHKFTGAEASAEGSGEAAEIGTALQQIYSGSPTAAGSTITLNVTKPNQRSMKIIWPRSAFDNCMSNISTVTTLEQAKSEIIPRVHPQTYKAFLKAAFELDAEELEINSGWRPMLGSVLHRIGVGLDVGRIKAAGENSSFRRSATAAETEYANLMAEKSRLKKKQSPTEAETQRLNEIKAIESAKASAATKAIHDNESDTLRSFTGKLRKNGDVKQTFDPWEMDVNTGDATPAVPNRLATGNEKLHKTHLHITVRDSELGH